MVFVARSGSVRRLLSPLCLVLLAVAMCLAAFPGQPTATVQAQDNPPERTTQQQSAMEQMRAFWVPMHDPGLHNPAQVDELVNNVKRANANTIVAQMRRHGDSLYNNSLEPRAIWPNLAPADQFDPLAYLIQRAHAEGIRVHAWFVVSVVCRTTDPLYGHPQHLCTQHGPTARGAERWTTATYGGAQIGDMDFGHPGAQIHFENVVQHLVLNYPEVDGVHLDFIRYADINYGYNQVSLDRFRQFYGLSRDYYPSSTDSLWSQWRRDRVTELVRRVYLRTKAIDPTIEVSVAAITWGGDGSNSAADFVNSAAYRRVFQDWRSWLEEGIIDFAMPMMYFEEGVPRSRAWYNSWLNFGRYNAGRRAIVPGTGAWLNTDAQGIAQIQRALTPDAQGASFPGVALYAYNEPLAGSNFDRRRQFMDQLRATVFEAPAQAPNWPWVYYHDRGHLQGIAAVNGKIISDQPNAVNLIRDGEWLGHIPTMYDGWYGIVDLEPGVYNLLIEDPETGETVWHEVIVNAGQVTNGP